MEKDTLYFDKEPGARMQALLRETELLAPVMTEYLQNACKTGNELCFYSKICTNKSLNTEEK